MNFLDWNILNFPFDTVEPNISLRKVKVFVSQIFHV